ncbi:MAG: hypothetical protein ARM1_0659 [Candidatus Micrarchaeota archaeon]|nr:MAG: hypothetical protein ARM1_0659 [Candidatus Micrarchaeota archaeon]
MNANKERLNNIVTFKSNGEFDNLLKELRAKLNLKTSSDLIRYCLENLFNRYNRSERLDKALIDDANMTFIGGLIHCFKVDDKTLERMDELERAYNIDRSTLIRLAVLLLYIKISLAV